jgi:dipeptide transport system substrate-binding protein
LWAPLDATLPERRDVERAMQLIKTSGYDGRELTMFVTDNAVTRRAGELLQSDWARIGVKVKLLALEAGERTKRSGKGEHDILLASWVSDNGDPDNFFTPNLSCAAVASGGNKSRWCNAAFDALLEEARKTTDLARRTELYKKAQRLLYDEVGLIPLTYPESFLVMHKRVSGFVASPMDVVDFRGVSVK